MKAIILDMYGVILKDSGDGFYSYVNRTFPQLTPADIYPDWDKADVGKSLPWRFSDVWDFRGIWRKLKEIIWIPWKLTRLFMVLRRK